MGLQYPRKSITGVMTTAGVVDAMYVQLLCIVPSDVGKVQEGDGGTVGVKELRSEIEERC